jgi:hypothetical protein
MMYLNPLPDSDVASDAKTKKNGKTLEEEGNVTGCRPV